MALPPLAAAALRLLDRFVPPSEGVWQFRGRVVVGISWYASALLLVFSPVWYLVGPGIAAGCVVLSLGLLVVGPVQRASGSVVVGANVLLFGCYLLEAWAVWLTGGIRSPFMGVAWVTVLYAGVLLGFRGGLAHAAVVSLGTVALAFAGYRFVSPAPIAIDAGVFSFIAVPPAVLTCAVVLGAIERYGAVALRREAEARLRAEQASRAKSEFLGVVSHELRSPLAGILGASELLERRLPEPEVGLARTIAGCGERLSVLVEDLLDLRVAESGALVTNPVPFSPRTAVEQVVEIASRAHPSAPVPVLEVAPEVPAWLLGDAARLDQILLNLVANALRHGAGAPVTVRLSGALRVEVQDRGPGIAKDDLARVFEPFTRLDPSYRRSTEGSGLGLAICRRLVHAMGGEIGVDSRLGQGATFWFTLALPRTDGPEPTPPAPAPAPSGALELLVVDDQDSVRAVFAQMFEALGHRVVAVDGVLAALDACATRSFDAVFLDIAMPGLDGVEGARRLRALPKQAEVRLVALTANASAEDRARYLAAGFDDVVPKPARMLDLQAALGRRARQTPLPPPLR